MHWLCFYGSVKLANASVAATTMALAPVVVALVEPWLTAARFERHNLLLGIAVIPGVALVVGGLPGEMHLGFWVGVASAALAALFNLLNKRHLGSQDTLAVTGIELGAGFLLLTLLSAFGALGAGEDPAFVLPSVADGAWLLAVESRRLLNTAPRPSPMTDARLLPSRGRFRRTARRGVPAT